MSKISLTSLVNLQNETTAVNAINNNNAALTTAFDNTLSRDGTSPNPMLSNLDMNSNQILNLPSPATTSSPARLVDVVSNPTITVPPVGTSGAVVGLLNGNNTYSGTSNFAGNIIGNPTFTGNAYFKSGKPWADITAYGADPSGVLDSSTAIQNAITAVSALGGGTVYIPTGQYFVQVGINVLNNVTLQGANINGSIIQSWHVDVVTVTLNSGSFLKDLTVFGKGVNQDTGTFGASNPAVQVQGVFGGIINCVITGGAQTVYCGTNSGDNLFLNVNFGGSTYGVSNTNTQGANWYLRCKIDNSTTGITVTNGPSFPTWAATTAYTVGQVVINGAFLIQCSSAGTSGGSAPVNKNYLVPMTDGGVTWLLYRQGTYYGWQAATGAGENHFTQCDFSGAYSSSMNFSQGTAQAQPPVTVITDSVLSAGAILTTGNKWVSFSNCELAGTITVAATYTGNLSINNCYGVSGGFNVGIGAAVSNFLIGNNNLGGGTVTVAAGASDHYNKVNNLNVTVTDNGTGVNKTISGNH